MEAWAGKTPTAELQHGNVERILERYQNTVGPFHASRIDGAGYIIQRVDAPPSASNDWFFLDLDDTLVGTTMVKARRQELFEEHIQNQLGIGIEQHPIKGIMDNADKFSRWEETHGAGEMYHASAHILALSWAEKLLTSDDLASDDSCSTFTIGLDRIRKQLDRENEWEAEAGDPFHFDSVSRQLVREPDSYWSEAVESIIDQTMVHPPVFGETVRAAEILRTLGQASDFNLGIFTYGEPSFQLLKILEFLNQNPELDISQIWLSSVKKGAFINAALEQDSTHSLHELVSPTPRVAKRFVPQNKSGNPLGRAPQTVIFLDDNPKELDSVEQANSIVSKKSGTLFTPMRSIQAGTREADKVWDGAETFVVDSRTNSNTAEDIASRIRTVRDLVWKTRLEGLVRYDVDDESRIPLKSVDSIQIGNFFTRVVSGTTRGYSTVSLLNEGMVEQLSDMLGQEIDIDVEKNNAIFRYLEDEEHSTVVSRYTGKLEMIEGEGLVLGGATGTAREMGIGTWYDLPIAKSGNVFLPFDRSDFAYRESATSQRIIAMRGDNTSIVFSNAEINIHPAST